MMVALGLASLVLVVLSTSFSSTMKVARWESARASAQGRLVMTMSTVENLLQRSCAMAVGYQPGLLAVQTRCDGPLPAAKDWESAWTCVIWDQAAHTLYLRRSPASLPPAKPSTPTPADLLQLALQPAEGSRMLSQGVSDFRYELLPGPAARVNLQLEVDIPGKVQKERFQVERRIYFRERR